MLKRHERPWGISHMSPVPSAAPAAYEAVHLDPVTQQAIYVGPGGKPIEAGKHGTNKQTSKTQRTGGGDGQNPPPPDQTTLTDFDDD